MNNELMRQDITRLIDDIKYHSDALTNLDQLPIIQLNIILAKMTKMVERTIILKHLMEEEHEEGKLTNAANAVSSPPEVKTEEVETIQPVIISEEIETPIEAKEQAMPKAAIDIAEKLQETPIQSIKSAIGIYEKYLFANELFNGSVMAFDEAVSELDSFDTFEKADQYIEQGLMVEYKWNEENEQVDTFRKLVQRRYS